MAELIQLADVVVGAVSSEDKNKGSDVDRLSATFVMLESMKSKSRKIFLSKGCVRVQRKLLTTIYIFCNTRLKKQKQ